MNADQTDDDKKLLIEHAVTLLTRRPQSVFELNFKLKRLALRKQISNHDELIRSIIEELEQRGIMNDDVFATWYAQERFDFKQISKMRLRKELAQKGIPSDSISRTLESYDEELACRTLANRKRHMKKEQLISYLQRQGFSCYLIEQVLAIPDRF